MKVRNSTLLNIYLALFTCSINAQDIMLESEVTTEFNILRSLAREPQTKLEFDYTNGVSSVSKTSKSILVFNIPQLKEIENRIGVAYKKDFIRLIVAHELAHQIQYKYYHNISGGLLYECQADIIGGFLIYQLIGKDISEWNLSHNITSMDDPGYTKMLKDLEGRVYASLTQIFQAGVYSGLGRKHPSNEERRLALRDGLAYGNIWLYGEVLINAPSAGNPTLTYTEKIRLAKHYQKLLNYLPGDNIVTWSLRHAKKVIHDYLPNARYIVTYSETDWDTSKDNPYVYYEQIIKNEGDKTITLNYYTQIYTVKRDDPKNTLYWDLRATNSHNFTLKPGETREVIDSLKWVATTDYMPRIVHLGDEGSLFSCTTLSDNREEASSNIPNHYSGNSLSNDAYILEIMFSSRSLYDRFINGVGTVVTRSFKSDVSFVSLLKIPSSIGTDIKWNRKANRYDLDVFYYYGKNKIEALKSAERLIANIKLAEHIVKISNKEIEANDKEWEILSEKGEVIGSISMYEFKNGNYQVKMLVLGL